MTRHVAPDDPPLSKCSTCGTRYNPYGHSECPACAAEAEPCSSIDCGGPTCPSEGARVAQARFLGVGDPETFYDP